MKTILSLLTLTLTLSSYSQLEIDTAFTVERLIDKILVGKGIRVGNVELKGNKVGLGYFQTDTHIIGMSDGILLSTGNVYDAIGENDTPGQSGVLYSYGQGTASKRLRKKGRSRPE